MERRFRLTLVELSKHITSDVLDSLKYICQDAVVPSRMEKVKNALDLFLALEECGKISMNDTQYLIELLEAEGKSSLVSKLTPFNHGMVTDMFPESLSSYDDVPQRQQQQAIEFHNVSEARLNVYRQLLRRISNSLRAEDIQRLCCSSQEAEMAGIRHKANANGTTLFDFFEKRTLISPDNLEYLKELLCLIGRLDLQNLIEQYTRSYLAGYPLPLNRQTPYVQQYDYNYPANNPSYHQGNNTDAVYI